MTSECPMPNAQRRRDSSTPVGRIPRSLRHWSLRHSLVIASFIGHCVIHWSLRHSLVFVHCSLGIGHWSLVFGHWSLVIALLLLPGIRFPCWRPIPRQTCPVAPARPGAVAPTR